MATSTAAGSTRVVTCRPPTWTVCPSCRWPPSSAATSRKLAADRACPKPITSAPSRPASTWLRIGWRRNRSAGGNGECRNMPTWRSGRWTRELDRVPVAGGSRSPRPPRPVRPARGCQGDPGVDVAVGRSATVAGTAAVGRRRGRAGRGCSGSGRGSSRRPGRGTGVRAATRRGPVAAGGPAPSAWQPTQAAPRSRATARSAALALPAGVVQPVVYPVTGSQLLASTRSWAPLGVLIGSPVGRSKPGAGSARWRQLAVVGRRSGPVTWSTASAWVSSRLRRRPADGERSVSSPPSSRVRRCSCSRNPIAAASSRGQRARSMTSSAGCNSSASATVP